MMTALINISFGSLLVNANDSLYDPTRSRQKEEDCTSSLTRFTYLDLIGFVVVVHIELCLLDFISLNFLPLSSNILMEEIIHGNVKSTIYLIGEKWVAKVT
jgi:hypothetical protein